MVDMDTFNAYINSYEEDTTSIELKQIYLDSADSMIKDHIGYDYLEADYTHIFNGNGLDYIQLFAFPVTNIEEVKIDGVLTDLSEFIVDRERLIYNDKIFNQNSKIVVKYTAGNAETPGIVKLVQLQIAGLLFTESNGNIGVTSKSFDGGNSRTFIKTTNFQPYLSKLDALKLVRY